ncbi:MAG: class I SAM-dependent methyltransferase [Hyphomicrobiaceae bacterium]
MPLVARGGDVLDVACGSGRHLRHGLSSGYRMIGIDRDLSRICARGAETGLELIAADLEDGSSWPLGNRRFAGVIVTNYLWRPLLPTILAAAAPHGVVIYETFAAGNERFGRPKNPDFLLRPGELIDIVRPALAIIAYEHVHLTGPDRIVQRIAAVARGHPLACELLGPV